MTILKTIPVSIRTKFNHFIMGKPKQRHALPQIDGEESSEDDLHIVTEHLYVISPALKQDHHSVQGCQNNVVDYLKEIGYSVEFMHEWMDGCLAQYKSCHCMGDVSFSLLDFGFPTVRNYFVTCDAKGPQDGASANLKHKADMTVIRCEVVIENAEDLFEFARANLTIVNAVPVSSC